ncbi:hypothetical protein G6F68_021139 [Rhizopus microsporus]|nr:hypothetical protein G6F68_021139 [Rhizopus microsporus]
MRRVSNGMSFGPRDASLGSAITFALMRSRAARERNTTKATITVSPGLALTARGNDVLLPGSTSSATHSVYCSAPCSFHTAPALRARRP